MNSFSFSFGRYIVEDLGDPISKFIASTKTRCSAVTLIYLIPLLYFVTRMPTVCRPFFSFLLFLFLSKRAINARESAEPAEFAF